MQHPHQKVISSPTRTIWKGACAQNNATKSGAILEELPLKCGCTLSVDEKLAPFPRSVVKDAFDRTREPAVPYRKKGVAHRLADQEIWGRVMRFRWGKQSVIAIEIYTPTESWVCDGLHCHQSDLGATRNRYLYSIAVTYRHIPSDQVPPKLPECERRVRLRRHGRLRLARRPGSHFRGPETPERQSCPNYMVRR